VLLNTILLALALLSLALTLWQWFAAWRFPLHQRVADRSWTPALTLLKPLKGRDAETEACLRSWLAQEYRGDVQILFGVASAQDPVCDVVRRLLQASPARDAQLVVCGPLQGANLKVSKLMQLESMAKHEVLVISDADVRVPPDFLVHLVAPLKAPAVGLVNCFYRLANPATFAMRWEAVAVNADFWSQVLQAQMLKPLDFALGAVMATRRAQLAEVGGFAALADCLADDYQLGHRIAQRGHSISLCPVVVECWSEPMGWRAVWKHQLRWARTIRVCQPVPYFFSILSNATLWPGLWLLANRSLGGLLLAVACWLVRIWTALHLQQRLSLSGPSGPTGVAASCNEQPSPQALGSSRSAPQALGCVPEAVLVLLKDMLQATVWLLAFLGNRIEWRGEKMHLRRDGTLVRQ